MGPERTVGGGVHVADIFFSGTLMFDIEPSFMREGWGLE